jgi:Uma2 family endonuclease
MTETLALPDIQEAVKSKPRRRKLPLPLTYEERADMGKREVRVTATWEEYLELSQDCDYRVHYRNGEIISFIEIDEKTKTIMGEATITHERLIPRLIYFLAQLLEEGISDYQILGSNAKLFLENEQKAFFADAIVINGEAIQKSYSYNTRTSKGIVNPHLIVEVLSDSTRKFDINEKLADYKGVESLEQIIFVEQGRVWASTYIRKEVNEWLNLDFNTLAGKIPVAHGFIDLEKVYSKIL